MRLAFSLITLLAVANGNLNDSNGNVVSNKQTMENKQGSMFDYLTNSLVEAAKSADEIVEHLIAGIEDVNRALETNANFYDEESVERREQITENITNVNVVYTTCAPSKAPSVMWHRPTASPAPSVTVTDLDVVTPSPTSVVTPIGVCNVDVDLECFYETKNGTIVQCEDITQPSSGLCTAADGQSTEITEMTFTFTGNDCEEESNSHGDASTCRAVTQKPSDYNGSAKVECIGSDLKTYFSEENVQEGSPIVINLIDGRLPSLLACGVGSSDGVDTYQIVTFGLNSLHDTHLKDSFGAITLENCSTEEAAKNCRYDVTVKYQIDNTGDTVIDISKLDQTKNGATESILDQVPIGLDVINPGESKSFQVNEVLDVCTKSTYDCVFDVEANPPTGDPCENSAQLKYETYDLPTPSPTPGPTPGPTTPPTLSPTLLPTLPPPTPPPPTPRPPTPPPPTPRPPTPPPPTLPPTPPPSSHPTYDDIADKDASLSPTPAPSAIPPSLPAPITTAAPITLAPTTLAPVEPAICYVTVEVECIADYNGETPCTQVPAGAGIVKVTYTYYIENKGSNNVEVASLTSTRNGITTDLTREIDAVIIGSGGKDHVNEHERLDFNTDKAYEATVTFVAEPQTTHSASCIATDTLEFDCGEGPVTMAPSPPPTEVVPDPTPAPTKETPAVCDAVMEIECTLDSDNETPCDDITWSVASIVSVTYTYVITNGPSNDINIISLESTMNGDENDLTDLVNPKKLIANEQIIVKNSVNLDTGITQKYTTDAVLKTQPISSSNVFCFVEGYIYVENDIAEPDEAPSLPPKTRFPTLSPTRLPTLSPVLIVPDTTKPTFDPTLKPTGKGGKGKGSGVDVVKPDANGKSGKGGKKGSTPEADTNGNGKSGKGGKKGSTPEADINGKGGKGKGNGVDVKPDTNGKGGKGGKGNGVDVKADQNGKGGKGGKGTGIDLAPDKTGTNGKGGKGGKGTGIDLAPNKTGTNTQADVSGKGGKSSNGGKGTGSDAQSDQGHKTTGSGNKLSRNFSHDY